MPQSTETAIVGYPDAYHSIAKVFKTWFMNDTLWRLEYCECLSDKAIETFKRYALFRDGRVVDGETGTRHSPQDEFRIKCSHTKRLKR